MKVHTARFYHTCSNCDVGIVPGMKYSGGRRKTHYPDCSWKLVEDVGPPDFDASWWESLLGKRDEERLLWSHTRVAGPNFRHECGACLHSRSVHQQMMSEIFPGDTYVIEVWANRLWLDVRYYHSSCPFCPDDDDEWMRDQEEDDSSQDLPMAA